MNYPLFLRTELLIKYVRLMDKILNLDSVDLYNKLYGLETLNPLVSVIDLNKATSSVDLIRFNYGIYALYLKLEKACDIKYGRQTYDYQEGTIVCFAPGQTAETNPTTDKVQVNAHGILFHPDLLRGFNKDNKINIGGILICFQKRK